MSDPLAALLREQGWEPDSNVCRCGHPGGDHDLNNWCLVCQPPRSDYFASSSEAELWANATARLRDAGVTLQPAAPAEGLDPTQGFAADRPTGPRTEKGHALASRLRTRMPDAEVDWDAWIKAIEDAAEAWGTFRGMEVALTASAEGLTCSYCGSVDGTTPPAAIAAAGETHGPVRIRSANCQAGDHDDCASMVEQDAPGLGITDCLCDCHWTMTPTEALAAALDSLDDHADTHRIWRAMGSGRLAAAILAALDGWTLVPKAAPADARPFTTEMFDALGEVLAAHIFESEFKDGRERYICRMCDADVTTSDKHADGCEYALLRRWTLDVAANKSVTLQPAAPAEGLDVERLTEAIFAAEEATGWSLNVSETWLAEIVAREYAALEADHE